MEHEPQSILVQLAWPFSSQFVGTCWEKWLVTCWRGLLPSYNWNCRLSQMFHRLTISKRMLEHVGTCWNMLELECKGTPSHQLQRSCPLQLYEANFSGKWLRVMGSWSSWTSLEDFWKRHGNSLINQSVGPTQRWINLQKSSFNPVVGVHIIHGNYCIFCIPIFDR